MSRSPGLSFTLSASVYGATAVSVGMLLVRDALSNYVPATAANRASLGRRAEAVALTPYGGPNVGSVQIQEVGTLDPAISGLGTGTASWVRASAGGFAERVANPTAADDVIGWGEADGSVHLHFALPGIANVPNGLSGDVVTLDGAGGFANGGTLPVPLLPAPPSADGTYNLKITSGVASWVSAAAVFDPAARSLTGYWKDYTADPWAGTASAGSSGTRSLPAVTAGTAGPLYGTHTSVALTGGQYLQSTTYFWDALTTRTAYYFNFIATYGGGAAAPGAQPYNDNGIIGDNGGNIYCGVSSSGLRFGHYDDATFKVTGFAPFSTGVKHFVECWYDGTNLHLAVDGVEVTPVAAASFTTAYSAIRVRVGTNFDASKHFNGSFAGMRSENSVPSSGVRASYLADARANYGTV